MNGHQVANHSGGHLPFEADITDVVTGGAPNDIMVAINNTLTPHTLPPGTLSFRGPPNYPEGYFVQNVQFDFFNYAGIHRPVKLYTTPIALHIDDITVTTALLSNGSAQLDYEVEVGTSGNASVSVDVMLMGSGATGVNSARSLRKCRGPKGELCSAIVKGSIMVDSPKLWWPWTMSDSPGHLYPLQVGVNIIIAGTCRLELTSSPAPSSHWKSMHEKKRENERKMSFYNHQIRW